MHCKTTAYPATDMMTIDYELGGRFWHRDCKKARNGIMRPVSHEENSSTIECMHCGMRGSYPVGAVGERTVDAVPSVNENAPKSKLHDRIAEREPQIEQKVSELQKDAERYQWLRQHIERGSYAAKAIIVIDPSFADYTDSLDTFIDAQLAK